MTQRELTDAYALAALPFNVAEGPIPRDVLGLKSWRYLVELNTGCNLRCVLCASGNREGYEYFKGNKIMDMGLMEKVLDKIKAENPGAIVCPYGNGEPFLHPQYPDCIQAVKRRGFRCEVATNLNVVNRLDEFLLAKPDLVIVSVSGFSQELYGKTHRGGDIEKVKANMKLLKEASVRTGDKVAIAVSYHMYEDNLHEIDPMKEFVAQFGFMFMLSWARTISIENTVQCLRELENRAGKSLPPFSWEHLFPPAKPEYLEAMDRLRFHPRKAQSLYARFPVAPVCIIADVFTYIRYDGTVHLCCWCDDKRLTLGNYLEMNQEQISEARRGHPLCQECLRYRLNLYYHVVDCFKWDGMNGYEPK